MAVSRLQSALVRATGLGVLLWSLIGTSTVHAADLYHGQATALKAPDCITDAAASFIAQNVQLAAPPHPTLPIGRYYLIVRYLGDSSIAGAPAFDFGRFPDDYAWPPIRDMALTNLSVPEPRSNWQRASRVDATMDTSSAFQLHCYDAGSFINTWTFPFTTISGGGAHSIYGYSFDDAGAPAIYDSNTATDFVLQASIEIPWFAKWPNPELQPESDPLGQVNLFAYFRDRTTHKTFALLMAIFDDRFAANPTYSPFVLHDGATPFVSLPLNGNGRYATLSPYSSVFSGATWTGLRFFRGHVTQDNFGHALADINAFCVANPGRRYCDVAPDLGTAFSQTLTDYEITDFGVIHEIAGGGPYGNLSMGMHVYGLGAWTFR
jgi:hypothetical protein